MWVSSGWNLKKAIFTIEISTLEFLILQSFMEKIKILKFRTEIALFGYFLTGI